MRMIFEEVLPRQRPLDGVVIMVGATDMVTWFEAGAPADWQPAKVIRQEVFPRDARASFAWHPKGWALADVARRLKGQWLRPKTVRDRAGGTLAKVRAMRAAAKEIVTDVPEPTGALRAFEEHLRGALMLAKASARRVLVVRQPCFWKEQYTEEEKALFWSWGIGNPYHQDVTRYFDLQAVGAAMEAMNDVARKVAEEVGVSCLDLMPHLERSAETYYDFNHLTPKGAREVGELVAQAYLEKDLPAPRYAPERREPRVGV
jgi:hypothetical protein